MRGDREVHVDVAASSEDVQRAAEMQDARRQGSKPNLSGLAEWGLKQTGGDREMHARRKCVFEQGYAEAAEMQTCVFLLPPFAQPPYRDFRIEKHFGVDRNAARLSVHVVTRGLSAFVFPFAMVFPTFPHCAFAMASLGEDPSSTAQIYPYAPVF